MPDVVACKPPVWARLTTHPAKAGPGCVFVVEGAVSEATVEVAEEAVAECA